MDFLVEPSTRPFIQRDRGKKPRFPWWIVVLVVGIVGGVFLQNSTEFLKFNEKGEPELSSDRKAKLERELDEFDNAEQYALLAMRDGDYPCFHCKNKTTIFLSKGEIWKYGVTRKGEKERYGEWHIDGSSSI